MLSLFCSVSMVTFVGWTYIVCIVKPSLHGKWLFIQLLLMMLLLTTNLVLLFSYSVSLVGPGIEMCQFLRSFIPSFFNFPPTHTSFESDILQKSNTYLALTWYRYIKLCIIQIKVLVVRGNIAKYVYVFIEIRFFINSC